MSLLLVFVLSLSSVIGVAAQENTKTDEQLQMSILTYVLSLPNDLKEDLVSNPEQFVKDDAVLNEYISQLSTEYQNSFYEAIKDDELLESPENSSEYTVNAISPSAVTKMIQTLEALLLKSGIDVKVTYHAAE